MARRWRTPSEWIAASATTAPLNPACRGEIHRPEGQCFGRAPPRDHGGPALALAARRGVRISRARPRRPDWQRRNRHYMCTKQGQDRTILDRHEGLARTGQKGVVVDHSHIPGNCDHARCVSPFSRHSAWSHSLSERRALAAIRLMWAGNERGLGAQNLDGKTEQLRRVPSSLSGRRFAAHGLGSPPIALQGSRLRNARQQSR